MKEDKIYMVTKKRGASEAQKMMESIIRKTFCKNDYSPLWITKSIEGYFKKGKS